MLDWDSTKIVFTKRTLLEFLKSTGTTVDPNFTNLSKLPRYATFGTLAAGALSDTQDPVAAEASGAQTHDTFIPTRRVRDPPGGKHHDIFANDQEDDALSTAPPKLTEEEASTAGPAAVINSPPLSENTSPDFKPSRRVREMPGGRDSISNLWNDDAPQEQFKPTRRVRQGPGGTDRDHVTGIF
ncbi:hypothetical protein FIBSPDRAFT_856624 [Athelia psychrophila]|uniref:Uncharacterized protein n=1 Tax=Athelia psychrophila TaxID=1759441 RepID=A0A166NB69_9AGAM|nr:hypothetical protein FIBSPDRAFT_856624 [Fibularhizoctonia sp. CBS 109695]